MGTVILTEEILEERTGLYEMDLLKEDGAGFTPGEISTLTITYYDLDTLEIINSRDFQDCLNLNNVTLANDGHLTWEIQITDSIIIDSRKELEQHIVLFTWGWDSGARAGSHEIQFPIRNLTLVA